MSVLDALDSRSSALLVIDMQNAFVHAEGTLGISGVDTSRLSEPTPRIASLVKRFQAARVPVLWTVQEHFAADRRRARKRLPSHTAKRKRVSALTGTWDAEIVDELKPLVTDPALVIRKHRFGAFYQTRLDITLEMLGVEALFITGTTTNACIETTIREAYLRDYDVVAVRDCMAGVNAEWERVAQAVWGQYFGVVLDSAEVLAWLDAQERPRTLGLAHLLLQCRDLEAARRFYVDVLGFSVRSTKPLDDGRPFVGTHQGLGLTDGGPGDRRQVDHIAFRVHDVAALADRCERARTRVIKPLGPGIYGQTIYVADPDGNTVELFEEAPASP